jgi:hypothetical protein
MSQLYFPASAEISLVCLIRILCHIVPRGDRQLDVFFTDLEICAQDFLDIHGRNSYVLLVEKAIHNQESVTDNSG